MIRFDGRVAIVTGAGRGLGRAHALDLARRGARVVVNDPGFAAMQGGALSNEVADAVVREIVANGGVAMASYHDIGKPDAARALVDSTVAAWGQVDVVVNNAGLVHPNGMADMSHEEFVAMADVHLFGAFNVAQQAYRHMKTRKYGRLVFTTSQVAFFGKKGAGGYGAVKAGVLGILSTLRLEAARHGVLCNAISPFAVTRMSDGVFPEELAGLLIPEQVTAGVTYLASEGCELNGAILIAGGGHFALAEMWEGQGVDVPDPLKADAEFVAANIAELKLMKGARHFQDSMDPIGITLDRLHKLRGSNKR